MKIIFSIVAVCGIIFASLAWIGGNAMDRNSLASSLLGSGRASGLTIDGLIRLAERAAASSGISEDLAGRIAASYVRKGLPAT